MPMLEHVMTDLGMEPTVREIAGYAAMRAKQAILAPTERRDDDNHPEKRADRSGRSRESGETETGFADRVDYVSEHGLRSMGMIALIDQEYCRYLARLLADFLLDAGSPSWPLAMAGAPYWPMPDPAELFWLVERLKAEPPGTPRSLASCLMPDDSREGDAFTYRSIWSDDVTSPRWSRQSLAPYGINLELLITLVRGHTPGSEPMAISEISTPALAQVFFRSIENALGTARRDEYHWAHGMAPVQPTDPEVLLAVNACLRSEAAGPAVRNLPPDLPMSRALVELVQVLDPATQA